jgi:hypothetical protein
VARWWQIHAGQVSIMFKVPALLLVLPLSLYSCAGRAKSASRVFWRMKWGMHFVLIDR